MMIKGGRWTVGFLAVTGTALAAEIYASWDDDPGTVPWTDLIVTYIPPEITAIAIGGLAAWLPVHFGLRYWRARRQDGPGNTPRSS